MLENVAEPCIDVPSLPNFGRSWSPGLNLQIFKLLLQPCT